MEYFFSKKRIFVIVFIVFIIIGIFVAQKGWTPSKQEEMSKEKNITQEMLRKVINWKIISKGIEIPLGGFGNFSQILNFSSKISAEKAEEVRESNTKFLYFNPDMNSGWFYIAQTIPEKGIAFWAAAVRTFSAQPTDKSGLLLYGIIEDTEGVEKRSVGHTEERQQRGRRGADFQFRIVPGSFFEDANKINLFFTGKHGTLAFEQNKDTPNKFKLNVNLSWCGSLCRQGKGVARFQLDKILFPDRSVIYESGDGVIPMGHGVDSLYVSLPLSEGFWIDFQKFNIPLASAVAQSFNWENMRPNHRWASFMLTEDVGSLPAGTAGVYWEIFDKKGNRQPGGYTNFDLLVPGKPQKTVDDFQIEEYEYSEIRQSGNTKGAGDTGSVGNFGKKYLKKWRLVQKELGVDLIFETLTDSANCNVQLPVFIGNNSSSNMLNFNFYEGMTKIYDSFHPEKQVGTGMLEQTHNEGDDIVN
jgi:hypothetical protein